MKLALFAALSVALTASAQSAAHRAAFTDPANLRGERVAPQNGRELPIDEGARGLEQMLRRLNTRASLMLIVAHPDDEDGGMLTLLSRGLGARVCDLSLTRGEGGQNAMTGDFEDALGLIRTQELLSSDRYLGADQMFGTEVDFGFSKTKEEAFSKWTRLRVLYDVVRAVRLYRPLVIAAVFIGGVTDGHGQHQVSGEIAQQAFNAAGDPTVFPELTAEGILPWKPLKVYARVPSFAITAQGLFDYATNQYAPARFTNYVTGAVSSTPPSVDVTIREGQTDPLLSVPGEPARSYVQFARLGLGLQKTQIGPNVRVPPAGEYNVGYHLYGSRLAHQPAQEKTFFDGIDTSVDGIASLSSAPPASLTSGLKHLSEAIAAAQRSYDPRSPGALAPPLAAAQDALSKMLYKLEKTQFPGNANVLHELRVKQVQLNDAIADALQLQMQASTTTTTAELTANAPVTVNTQLSEAGSEPVGVFAESLEDAKAQAAQHLLAVDNEPKLALDQPLTHDLEATPDLTAAVSRPYFFRTDIEQPVYQLLDPNLRNAPATPPALTAWSTLRYRGVEVRYGHVVTVQSQPLRIVPALGVALSTHAQAIPDDRRQFNVEMITLPATESTREQRIAVPEGWKAQPGPSTQAGSKSFQIELPQPRSAATLHASAQLASGKTYTEGYRPVGYGDLPRTDFFRPATDHVVPVDLRLPAHRRIGYLPGTGDAVPEALASAGLPVTLLSVADLTAERLEHFDTVVLGVRTYNAHPDLHGAPTQALLAFARNGGNVLVQYQTPEFTANDAPYPLSLGPAEKVVDETSPVQLLQPDAAVFTRPNHITTADFNGWIEERGHDFMQSWNARYAPLTETHDPGQAPQKGGLLVTQLGRGHWTYCAFALYRQLPEAVPGALRLFVNLLGLADSPGR